MQIQRAAGHAFDTALSLKDGFWQIRVKPEDIEKTSFTTHDGHFEWLVMPFGLTNAPATFESTLRRICYPFRNFIARLLDDMLIVSHGREEHFHRVGAVLDALHRYGFVLQPRKCHWFVSRVVFLGFVLDQSGIRPDPAKVQAIAERSPPSTITELRSFLNAAGYLRHFIPHFSGIANSLYDVTKCSPRPGTTIQFTTAHLNAFNALKQAISSSTVLKPIKFGFPVVIDTDASLSCIGAVLQQAHENPTTRLSELHPVAFESHKLTPTQQRYSAKERELLAVMYALSAWRTWVEGVQITVRTDHQSLSGIRDKIDIPPRINRFLDFIEHFNPDIIYRKGSLNSLPDYLSRPRVPCESPSAPDDVHLLTIHATGDPTWHDVRRIGDFVPNDNPDALNPEQTSIVRSIFMCFDGKRFRRVGTRLLCVENESTLMHKSVTIHKSLGHCSPASIQRELEKSFWHPNLLLYAQEALRLCENCSFRLPPVRRWSDLGPPSDYDAICALGIRFHRSLIYLESAPLPSHRD